MTDIHRIVFDVPLRVVSQLQTEATNEVTLKGRGHDDISITVTITQAGKLPITFGETYALWFEPLSMTEEQR